MTNPMMEMFRAEQMMDLALGTADMTLSEWRVGLTRRGWQAGAETYAMAAWGKNGRMDHDSVNEFMEVYRADKDGFWPKFERAVLDGKTGLA